MPKSHPTREFIPLMVAAMQLGLSRERTIRRLLKGELVGERRENGRWYIDPASMSRTVTARATRGAPRQSTRPAA